MSKSVQRVSESLPAGNLRKGVIQVPISSFRVVASNDVPAKGTPDGGVISIDTDPKLKRVNGATDKALRLQWESASVIEILSPPIALPPDLDDAADMTVSIMAQMKSASVDVPVIAVGAFFGIGDTNCGGNTAALSTSLQTLSVTLAAADVPAYPNFLNLSLAPGTHATASNDVYAYAVWVTYSRKA